MTPDQIANALTTATLGPAIGAALVLLAWLASAIKDGIPLRMQIRHAASQLRPVAVPSLVAGGLVLMAGEPWQVAAAAGITAALTAAGFRLPK